MNITGTHINYYFVCHRKLWLFANGIQMEHTSDLVYEGKLLHQTSYPQRPEKYEEIEIESCKIDFFDAKHNIIHEIKKTDKIEEAHTWQLKYYIYILEKNGIPNVSGILEYPAIRHTAKVQLNENDKTEILKIIIEINNITQNQCPSAIQHKICKSCSYHDFCYASENTIEP